MLVSVGLGGSLPWVNQQDEAETVVSLRSSNLNRIALLTLPAYFRPADGSYTQLSPA
jgi:hypothetical protein